LYEYIVKASDCEFKQAFLSTQTVLTRRAWESSFRIGSRRTWTPDAPLSVVLCTHWTCPACAMSCPRLMSSHTTQWMDAFNSGKSALLGIVPALRAHRLQVNSDAT
jgi:hypothetical protein